MEQIKPGELRTHLKTILNRVNDDHEPVTVVHGKGRSVVMLDAEIIIALWKPSI